MFLSTQAWKRRNTGKKGVRTGLKGVDNGSNGVWTVAGAAMRTTIVLRDRRQCSCKVTAIT